MTEVVKTLMMMFTPEFLSTSTTQPKFFFFFRFPDSLYSPLCCFFESIFPLCLGLDRRKRTCAVTVDGRKEKERRVGPIPFDADMPADKQTRFKVKPENEFLSVWCTVSFSVHDIYIFL